ncbi:MAG: glycosyltransferase, partial [Candidatus Helarchaeota archaeon]|nr:glycosyltransferase [Candidatus Helarchaeota archaeon]
MKNKTKIAFISTFWSRMGGAELTANLLKRELENFGFEIKVITTEFNNFDDSIIPIDFKIPIPDEIFFLGNKLLDKMIEKKIQEGLKKYNFLPDIIHVQQYFSLPASANVAKKLKIPLLVTIRVPLPTYLHHNYNFLIKFVGTQLIKGRNNLWINVLK